MNFLQQEKVLEDDYLKSVKKQFAANKTYWKYFKQKKANIK
jgi:hypothetical protein